VANNIFQKLPAPFGVLEESAFHNSIELFEHKTCLLCPNWSGLGSILDFAGMLDCGSHRHLFRPTKAPWRQFQWPIRHL
jgi:hypothetical protein